MPSFEDQFREKYPDCKITEEFVSPHLTRYHVMLGALHCSDSAIRELAFKYALQDIAEGRLHIPPPIEQLQLEL